MKRIIVTTINHDLHVSVEVSRKIPSAEGGQWSPERIAKLIESIEKVIKDTVEAAEMVDRECRNLNQSKTSSGE